jgi:hypothetical protein
LNPTTGVVVIADYETEQAVGITVTLTAEEIAFAKSAIRVIRALGAVGLKYGSVKRAERQLCGKTSLRVFDFFQELARKKHGTINCRDISHCDFTKPEEASAFLGSAAQRECGGLLTETVEFLLPLLDDPAEAK